MHAALHAPLPFGILRDHLRQLDLGRMQVLAGDLRQGVDLTLQHIVQALVGVAEVDRRVPHLQVEERRAGGVVQIAALAALEDLRRIGVVDRIAERAVARFQLEEIALLVVGKIVRHSQRLVDLIKHERLRSRMGNAWPACSLETAAASPERPRKS